MRLIRTTSKDERKELRTIFRSGTGPTTRNALLTFFQNGAILGFLTGGFTTFLVLLFVPFI